VEESLDCRIETTRHGHDSLELRRCDVRLAAFLRDPDPARRIRIRDVRLEDCRLHLLLEGVVLDEVHVDTARCLTRLSSDFWACLYRHVTLSGRISGLNIEPCLSPSRALEEPYPHPRQADFDADARRFYEGVDWALDLSRAKFTSAPKTHGFPGRLVRRDEETQALVTREVLSSEGAREVWSRCSLAYTIGRLLEDSPFDDWVLVAPRLARYFREELAAIEFLRREGLAT
jgi:hypothetical protein